jgi:hypothetical protein
MAERNGSVLFLLNLRAMSCFERTPLCAHWVADAIAGDVANADAAAIAHHLGGIVANDDRIRAAIESTLGEAQDLSDSNACQNVADAVAFVLAGELVAD